MNSKKQIAVKVAGSLLLALLLCGISLLAFCPRRTQTVIETVPEGVEAILNEEQQLREEMRPARGEERMLVFAIDGLGRDEMRDILSSDHAPHTRELVGDESGEDAVYERGYLAPDTLSILPSSTIAAWTTIFTGADPGDTGVPGNEFFVRERSQFYAFAPTSVASRKHALEALNDGLLNELVEVPTLYEQLDLRAYVSMSQIYRGADLFTLSDNAILKFVVSTATSPVTPDGEIDRGRYAALDAESFDALSDAWADHGLPDIQIIYLPGLDLFSHVSEDALRKQPNYYQEVIDLIVKKVLGEYKKQGVMDDTWVVFVSDHGHTPVVPDDQHALEVEDFAEEFDEIGYALRPSLIDVDKDEFTAVLASQGGLAYIYLADRSACEEDEVCDWGKRPRWDEDVEPVVKMLERYNSDPEGLARKIDVIITRDPGHENEAFRVWDNGELHDIEAWLERNDLDHQVEFARRLRALTDGKQRQRVGDIILVPRFGMRYAQDERYYFSKPMASQHGSATLEDSRFTLLVAHSRKSGSEIKGIVDGVTGGAPRQQHFVPLVKQLLEVD